MRLIVYAPPYTAKSGGIHVLHALAAGLVRAGADCRTLVFDSCGPVFDAPLWCLPDRMERRPVVHPDELVNAVAVYPEIVSDDPLGPYGISGRVRYLLNRDGLLTGAPVDRAGSLVVTYSRLFDPDAYRLFLPVCDTELFHDRGSKLVAERPFSCAYAGKNGHYVVPGGVAGNVVCVSRSYPADRGELAELLRNSRFLFTADPLTALNDEALLCGCCPVITDWGPWDSATLAGSELPETYHLNAVGDFSPGAVESARVSLLGRIECYRAAWDATLRGFVGVVHESLQTAGAIHAVRRDRVGVA